MAEKTPGDKEQQILAAAKERFAYYGFSKVTMDEVASDVGLVKGALYHYFPTKEDLFRAVIAQEQRLFLDEMRTIVGRPSSPGQKLRDYVKMRLRYFRTLINLNSLGLQSWIEVKSLHRDLFVEFERQELGLLQQILSEGRKNGDFRQINLQHTALLFLHLLQGLRLRCVAGALPAKPDNGAAVQLEQEMKILSDVFLHGIMERNTTKEA